MAIKIISKPTQQSQTPEEQSYLGQAGNIAKLLGSKAIEGVGLPGNILEGLVSLINAPISYATGLPSPQLGAPTTETVKKYVTEPLFNKFLGGYPQPEGPLQEVLANTAETLPLIAGSALTGGAAVLPSLGRGLFQSLGANVGSQAAKELGGGPLSQFAGGLIGGAGSEFIKRGGTPGGLRRLGNQQLKRDYAIAEEVAPKFTIDAKPLESFINEQKSKVVGPSSGLPSSVEREVYRELNKVDNIITTGKSNIDKIWKQKKHLNKLLRDETNSSAQGYYKRTLGELNKILDEASKQHPEFGIPYQQAENLYKGLRVPNKIRQAFENVTSLEHLLSNPIAKIAAFGSPFLLGKFPSLLYTVPGAFAGKYATRAYDFFTKSKAVQRLVKEVAEQTAEHIDTKALIPTLKKLNEEADRYAQQNPERKGKIKIISKG